MSADTPNRPSQPQPELSPELRRGRRALEGHREIALLDDWRWFPAVGRWALRCSLTPLALPAGSPLKNTAWFILADPVYPWGAVECYPAKAGGISETYPHQRYNSPGAAEVPWRAGLLCLSTERRILGREGLDAEPSAAGARLLWHVERALAWLRAAADELLLAAGDPYEVPEFPGGAGSGWRIGFAESASTFAAWRHSTARGGLVDLRPVPGAHASVVLVTSFRDPRCQAVVTPAWGTVAAAALAAGEAVNTAGGVVRGGWIRLDGCPLLPPWQAPATWGELRAACHAHGHELDSLLQEVVPGLRDGRRHVLLIGFPIPELIGGSACRMHWTAAHLPVLSHGAQTTKGFRPSERGYWLRDRREVLCDEAPIDWLAAENWDTESLASRGRLSPAITGRRIVLVGVGALGSVVAELLVRGGVTDLVVVDGETLEAGNLVRHTLTLSDAGRGKASALANRLNHIAPHAAVRGIDAPFPLQHEDERLVQARDLVIDCTGDDTVLEHLATFPWAGPMRFVSLSLGYRARRLWCFNASGQRFPHAAFRVRIAPWLERERTEYGGLRFPREGIGCWHPVFPARADDVWLLASAGVKQIEEEVVEGSQGSREGGLEQCGLVVFEQDIAGGAFIGVRRLAGDDGVQ